MMQWLVGPVERSGVVPACERNAMRLPPVRKVVFEAWQTMLQIPNYRTDDEAEKSLAEMSMMLVRHAP